ncbi:MAG TPA: hypothetical protein VHA78_03355 [Candidatus Peribacteraceae bacterium]|nr:hypothetical protein [Candidatus Peribacteraceae bacterium]
MSRHRHLYYVHKPANPKDYSASAEDNTDETLQIDPDLMEAQKMEDEVRAIDSIRKQMYDAVRQNIAAYCAGSPLPDLCWFLPPARSLMRRYDLKRMSPARSHVRLASRLFALINQHIDENRALILEMAVSWNQHPASPAHPGGACEISAGQHHAACACSRCVTVVT